MAVSLMLVMAMLAFVINVGLFVKAKINLQNAVDAAAFSGAATQARQLTNIAYLNWEMRNTYKEWMFKYYVLGQLSLLGSDYKFDSPSCSGPNASFLLKVPPAGAIGNNAGNHAKFDQYNIPSICIHNATSNDICGIYTLPGVPRFPSVGVAGISEVFESFVIGLVQKKAQNCSERTQINYLASLAWTFNSGINPVPGAPTIASHRPGAWLESLELALRMRNLEMIVNRPPEQNMTYQTASQLGIDDTVGLNERPIKAFMSAFRNLSGGKYKDNLETSAGEPDEFAKSFTLSELSPTVFNANPNSVSGFLIPNGAAYKDGTPVISKHYIDLQAMPVNLSTFFTTFVSASTQMNSNLTQEGTCLASKTALPVPGYLMGFTKNPQVLTYYAVKGTANFTGLFFPIASDNDDKNIKLTAYAAAKPFGGRIGPRLFSFFQGDQTLRPRNDKDSRSQSMIAALDLGTSGSNYVPGMPIPSNPDFWVTTGSDLGGTPSASGSQMRFGIPNLIYDAETVADLEAQSTGGSSGSILAISPRPSINNCTTNLDRGLYNRTQLNFLKNNLNEALGTSSGAAGNIDSVAVDKMLIRSRRATRYDAANYLIPDPTTTTNPLAQAPSATILKGPSSQDPDALNYELFAPLIQPSLLYRDIGSVEFVVKQYIKSMESSVDSYLKALYDVAYGIAKANQSSTSSSSADLLQAAQSIHANVDPANPNGNPVPPSLSAANCNNADLATKFNFFFKASGAVCNNVPLENLVIEYIQKKVNQEKQDITYATTYYNKLNPNQYMTAYMPGQRQGNTSGSYVSPIGVNPPGSTGYSLQRNFYSTKFIPLHNVTNDASIYDQGTLREGKQPTSVDLSGNVIINKLDKATNSIEDDFFSDF